ncbi:MAG: N-acetylmannosamine-6-phosphate 2-epimerase [Ignavibacteria bacterium]|nr:MAG: N-acetylmannosamine-6-phosphate 2-epimerase [Ignavibacteria bacterium]
MTGEQIAHQLHGGVIVSCHVEEQQGNDAFDALSYFVHAAMQGGAVGLRIEGVERIRSIRPQTKLPIIGFTNGTYPDGSPLITPSLDDIDALFSAGADIVAIDTTKRKRPVDTDGFLFFEQARKRFHHPLWADVATFREGVRAAEMRADFVATTLAGYTHGTRTDDYKTPDFPLIRELSTSLTIPVIAEGRIWSPEAARHCLDIGAYAVVVGSAITRPQIITQMFVDELESGSVEGAGEGA